MFEHRTLGSLALVLALIFSTPSTAGTVGSCQFDMATLSFAGSAQVQTGCLLRSVGKWGIISKTPATLPPTLAGLVGATPALSKEKLEAYLLAQGLPAPNISLPVSRANGGSKSAPLARYLVIHDTSTPYYGNDLFGPDAATARGAANLEHFLGPNAKAHRFVGRDGRVVVGHDFAVPWRATKFETKTVGVAAKGLFLHIEHVQPRRRDPGGGPKNDAIAITPGLTDAQYDRLAQLYVLASVRAGAWLIPAFHAVLDEGLADAHDDPQNFELGKFDAAVAKVLQAVGGPA